MLELFEGLSAYLSFETFDDLDQVRLLYERVSKQKRPIMAHLDDPVIVYIPLIRW